jgi:hypothetical protein
MFIASVFRNIMAILWREVVRTSSNRLAGPSSHLGYVQLHIQHILGYLSYRQANPQSGEPPTVDYLRMFIQYIRT